MSWFVDASAVVAIVGKEDDWESLADRLLADEMRLWSPLSRWESITGLRSRLGSTPETARDQIVEFAADWGFALVSIGEAEADWSYEAYRLFGKNSGHRAQLNMGDCFAYACVKTNGARLLYKGNDFKHTDIG